MALGIALTTLLAVAPAISPVLVRVHTTGNAFLAPPRPSHLHPHLYRFQRPLCLPHRVSLYQHTLFMVLWSVSLLPQNAVHLGLHCLKLLLLCCSSISEKLQWAGVESIRPVWRREQMSVRSDLLRQAVVRLLSQCQTHKVSVCIFSLCVKLLQHSH